MNGTAANVIAEFEAIGRTRALTDAESARLEEAVRCSGNGRRRAVKGQRPWSPGDVLRLRKMVRQRKKWVEMAAVLNRTPEAVGRKLRKLREAGKCGYISAPGSTGRYPRKSSKAEERVGA
jgi:hypothetical protein